MKKILRILLVSFAIVSMAVVAILGVLKSHRQQADPITQKLPQQELSNNYLGVVHWIEVTPDGAILPEIMSSTESTISFITKAHGKGSKVLLILYPEWYDPVAKVPYPHPGEIERGPVPNPEQFMEEMKQLAVTFATLAEKYNVEMFTPTTELNVFLTGGENREGYHEGWELVKRWHNETIPKVRAIYSGYLVPKGEVTWNKYRLDPIGDLSYFDYFSYYDYVAADIFEGDPPIRSLEEYKGYIKRTIGYLDELKKKYNAQGIILGPEIGLTPAVEALREFCPACTTEDTEKQLLEIFFTESAGKVDGFFFWDDWRHPRVSEIIQRYFRQSPTKIRGLDVWL